MRKVGDAGGELNCVILEILIIFSPVDLIRFTLVQKGRHRPCADEVDSVLL